MDQIITKRLARKMLRARTDTELATAFGITSGAVSLWGSDDAPIPEHRQWQILARKVKPVRGRHVRSPGAH